MQGGGGSLHRETSGKVTLSTNIKHRRNADEPYRYQGAAILVGRYKDMGYFQVCQ